jgi:predicted nucleic-acid-binding Zn-ribbon protein
MKQRCPKCGSENIEIYEEDLGFIKCKKCGYDDLEHEPIPYGIKKGQKEKASFTPYKTGGPHRTKK